MHASYGVSKYWGETISHRAHLAREAHHQKVCKNGEKFHMVRHFAVKRIRAPPDTKFLLHVKTHKKKKKGLFGTCQKTKKSVEKSVEMRGDDRVHSWLQQRNTLKLSKTPSRPRQKMVDFPEKKRTRLVVYLNLLSSPLISSQLLSSNLTSSQLISFHFISSHLIHLISSHLILYHLSSQLISSTLLHISSYIQTLA
eukprot:g65349.t1